MYRDSRRLEEFKEYYTGYTVSSFFVCIADSQKIKTPVFVANIAFHRAINVTHSLFTDASSLYGIFHKESTSHSGWLAIRRWSSLSCVNGISLSAMTYFPSPSSGLWRRLFPVNIAIAFPRTHKQARRPAFPSLTIYCKWLTWWGDGNLATDAASKQRTMLRRQPRTKNNPTLTVTHRT